MQKFFHRCLMKFAHDIIISWIMPFPASVVLIEFQIIRCISIQNGIPYLTDAEKKGKCNWLENDLIMRVFLFYLNQLFIYSTICVFIYIFIKQQLWMSTLAAITISIFLLPVQFNWQKEHCLAYKYTIA